MLDILKVHLDETETPEFIDMIETAHQQFERFNLGEDYVLEFIELMNDFDKFENPNQEVYDLTRKMQITLLRQHGISINEDSPSSKIPKLSDILESILMIEDTDQVDEIDTIIQSNSDPIEVVGRIFNVINPVMVVSDFLDAVEDVIHAIPKRILERVKNNRETYVASEEERITPEYQAFVKKALGIMGVTHVSAAASMYTKILPFEDYLPIIEEQVPDNPEMINARVYAKEMLTAAVISNAGQGNYLTLIKEYLDKNTDFPIQVHTQILVEIEKLNIELGAKPTRQ